MENNSDELLNTKSRRLVPYPVIDICYTSRELVGIDAKEPLLKHMREIYSTKNKFYN